MKYLARICYDGSKFQGFQRLNNGLGVQNELERVLSLIEGKEVVVKGAGRTDAGVHALDQCIHFSLSVDIDMEKLKYAMNRLLSPFIAVKSIVSVSSEFHARHDVVCKKYVYKIYLGEKNPFYSLYSFAYYQDFDLNLANACCKLFVGVHDFRNFVAGERDDYHSEIFSFQILKKDDFYYFEIVGKSFYRYMVRKLVGAVLDVASHKANLDDVRDALNCLSARGFSTVPANGLYLTSVSYDKV